MLKDEDLVFLQSPLKEMNLTLGHGSLCSMNQLTPTSENSAQNSLTAGLNHSLKLSDAVFKGVCFNPQEIKNIQTYDCLESVSQSSVCWLQYQNSISTQHLSDLQGKFNIHGLDVEDILDFPTRPKIEGHRSYLFCLINAVTFHKQRKLPHIEQVAIILAGNVVITIQEKDGCFFNQVQNRLNIAKSKLRNSGADYLFYSLLDAIVDNYYPVVERYHKKTLNLESKISTLETESAFKKVYRYKNELNLIKKRIYPSIEVLNKVQKLDFNHIGEHLLYYFKDICADTMQINDELNNISYRTTSLVDMIISLNSFKMNEIMKTLTVITTIFMPLTFISGIYGMNFNYIPELRYQWGYFMALGLMLVTALVMGLYVKKKKWI